jgi:hypothetical protein
VEFGEVKCMFLAATSRDVLCAMVNCYLANAQFPNTALSLLKLNCCPAKSRSNSLLSHSKQGVTVRGTKWLSAVASSLKSQFDVGFQASSIAVCCSRRVGSSFQHVGRNSKSVFRLLPRHPTLRCLTDVRTGLFALHVRPPSGAVP